MLYALKQQVCRRAPRSARSRGRPSRPPHLLLSPPGRTLDRSERPLPPLQATQGPCTKSAGWGWSVVESAKLQVRRI